MTYTYLIAGTVFPTLPKPPSKWRGTHDQKAPASRAFSTQVTLDHEIVADDIAKVRADQIKAEKAADVLVERVDLVAQPTVPSAPAAS